MYKNLIYENYCKYHIQRSTLTFVNAHCNMLPCRYYGTGCGIIKSGPHSAGPAPSHAMMLYCMLSGGLGNLTLSDYYNQQSSHGSHVVARGRTFKPQDLVYNVVEWFYGSFLLFL